MSDLSPEGESLVQAGKRAYRPSEADRDRVLQALRSRLGDGVVLGHSLAPSTARTLGARAIRLATSRWAIVGLAAMGVAAMSVGVHPSKSVGSASPIASAPVAATVTADTENGVDPLRLQVELAKPVSTFPLPANESTSARRPDVRQAPPRQVRDGLSDEIALLSRAEVDLNNGRIESALKELDEHQRRFPDGALVEERIAARVQALCKLGRNAEANSELLRLARTSPHSPLEERARQACRDARDGVP